MSKFPVIVFEGIEGSGKTTHINLVTKYLKKHKHNFLKIREPGGSLNSEKAISAVRRTLPATTISGRIYILKKRVTSGSFALTINPNSNEIDGSGATYTVSTSFIKLQSDGTNWWIIG